jgi:HK97 family phage major capsid protein
MTNEEKAQHDALISQIKSEIEKAQPTAELESLKSKIAELENKSTVPADYETLKSEVVRLATEVKSATEAPAKSESAAVEISKNLSVIKNIAKGEKKELVIKALAQRSDVAGNASAVTLPDIGQLAHRKLAAYDVFPKFPVSETNHNGIIRYYDWDEATTVRAAASVAEGALFPESTAKWQTYTLPIRKIGDTIPVTEELFEDSQMFAAELEMFLRTNVDIRIDDQLINGDNTGQNLRGVFNSVDAYTAVASGITSASIYDLIVKVKEAITTTGGAKYQPDVALMNIADINRMKLRKDTTNQYVLPPFVGANGTQVDGISILECNAVPANTMVVGDRRFARIYEMTGVEISQGFTGTQFAEDEMTLKARKRLLFLIRNADKGGFRKVTSISAALTTLAT